MTDTSASAESNQTEVVAFLDDPATYGLTNSSVQHIRTHISEVFLAGERAFKIKRAVRFAFADFSTVESRRAACEAEVRLNRRTAPDIYIAAVAIRRGPDGKLRLDAPGGTAPEEPIEWAVVMRRFDIRLTFDRLADRNALIPAWIDSLIDSLFAMHTGADSYGAPHGGRHALDRVIDDNELDMSRMPETFPPPRLGALLAAQRGLLRTNADLLDTRRDTGRVRRCHGDLHLGNVVLWRDQPVIFDCIEFSDALAIIDVAYDAAFLFMDLEARGFRALANRALNRYLGRQGEVEVLAALPLMMSLRACIRAKIAAMAAQGASDPADTTQKSAQAWHLFAAAERFVADAPPPCLVAVGGLSGSGKSTLAAALAPRLGRAPGALLLRSDVTRKRLANVPPEERLPAAFYTPKYNRRVYETLMREAAASLAAGQCVVVDAVFAREEERQAIETSAAGAPFIGIWLDAPARTLKDRVSQRVADASDATPEVVSRQLTMEPGPITWHRVDASDTPEVALATVLTLTQIKPHGSHSA